jgi:hypothetical protein
MKSGIDLFNALKPHVGEAYVMGTLVPKNNSGWRGPWDCAEFAIWGAYQVAAQLYGCLNDNGNPGSADAYTGYLQRDAETLGIKISVDQASRTPGAFILRLAANGVCAHVVVSDGNGGTVEAHGHADGVIFGKVAGRRWDYGILLPFLTYTENLIGPGTQPVSQPATPVYYLRQPMMVGPVVLEIENKLKALGYYHGALDSEYGGGLFSAVRSYQAKEGLNPDGEVGEKTAAALGISLE